MTYTGRTLISTWREVGEYELAFAWHGGPYIDISFAADFDAAPNPPIDDINVWDYEKDCARIPFTIDAFEARVDEWVNDPEMDHAHDLADYDSTRR